MFTLSEKIRVINSADDVKVYDASNTEVTTSGAISSGDSLRVLGFGSFEIDKITNIKVRRAVPAVIDSSDYTCVAPAGLSVGDAVEVIVSLNTDRYQSEVLVTNGLGKGRTIKFSTLPLAATTPAAISTAIVAGWTAYLNLYTNNTPFIEVVAGAAADDIKVQGLVGYESISIERVELKRMAQGVGFQAPVSLVENVVNSEGFEGHGLGKFLEESIRMSTPMNTDPYAHDVEGTRVDLRGSYTELSFEYASEYSANLATIAADYNNTAIGGAAVGGVPANHSFTLFMNESTMLAANSAIAKVAAIAIIRAGALAALTATVQAAPLTAAQERSEVLIFSDNSSVDTTAAFIA